MSRLHLFEFEDLKWFPKIIRDYMTDFLQFTANKFDFYKTLVPILKKGLSRIDDREIVDLASGGGGGWLSLSKHIEKEIPDIRVCLTDFYPNRAAFEYMKQKRPDFFTYSSSSVNALDVPKELHGKLRTQFLSFHHFKMDEAQQILQNAVDTESPILIVEAQKRSFSDFIRFFFSPINVLLITPFIQPFSFGRIFFTYIIPFVPIFVWWDGLVSVLRSYSKKEQEMMIEKLTNKETFDWEIDFVRNGPIKIYYLLGQPKTV